MVTWEKSKIDLGRLRIEIRAMSRHSKLYSVLKEELGKLDHWKAQKRGNPQKANMMIRNRKI